MSRLTLREIRADVLDVLGDEWVTPSDIQEVLGRASECPDPGLAVRRGVRTITSGGKRGRRRLDGDCGNAEGSSLLLLLPRQEQAEGR